MKSYLKGLICKYCGEYMGFIEYEDISELNITETQCSKCEAEEN
jgi:hypothetical protein